MKATQIAGRFIHRKRIGVAAFEVRDATTKEHLGNYGGRDGAKWAETPSGNTITEDAPLSINAIIGLIVSAYNNPTP